MLADLRSVEMWGEEVGIRECKIQTSCESQGKVSLRFQEIHHLRILREG